MRTAVYDPTGTGTPNVSTACRRAMKEINEANETNEAEITSLQQMHTVNCSPNADNFNSQATLRSNISQKKKVGQVY